MMKIETKTGNLLAVKSGHIVHGCNALGVMGSGVALAVKNTYPGAFESYRMQFETTGLTLGFAYPYIVNDDLLIWNAITQYSFGVGVRQVSYDAVETCFSQINQNLHDRLEFDAGTTPPEVHIPLLGAGRGGGNWEIIREIIEQTMDFHVTLWLPDDTVTTK